VNTGEARGYSFEPRCDTTDGAAFVHVFGQPIGICIDEPPRRVPHVLAGIRRQGTKPLAAAGRYRDTIPCLTPNSRSFSIILQTANAGAFHGAAGPTKSADRTAYV